jgi:predicted dehydrogenase
MDYTRQPVWMSIRKVLRYTRLFGPRRTFAKVRAQRHMSKTYSILPARRIAESGDRHVGIIGCGKFAYGNIAYYLSRNYGHVIRATMDVDLPRAASLGTAYGADYWTDNAEELLADPAIDLVYIASNHASHAEYAICVLEQGKSVHIEKPHVVTEEQLKRLCRAMEASPGRVMLGFNRPYSRIGRAIKKALDTQTGPAVYNWFVAGHAIPPDHWYFREEEGGRILGNLCHWTDFVLQMVPPDARYPIEIRPTRSLKSDVDIAVTYTFGDGSIAAITFSAKGHTFEGVRETFAAHRGDVLISMSDFKSAVIQVVEKTSVVSSLFRDHGHEVAIRRSYGMVRQRHGDRLPAQRKGVQVSYVWNTGQLFLKTKQALEEDRVMIVEPYARSA